MRPFLILAVALLAAPTPASAADVVLNVKSRSALRGVTIEPLAPASAPSRAELRLPVRSISVARGIGTAQLSGSLRFRAGKRTTAATALRLTTGTTSSSLSGKLGRTRVTLFSARGRPALGAGNVAVTGARMALTRAAAAKLKRALKLRRAPSTAALGTLDLAAPAPAAPAPPAPAATPAPEPNPEPSCAPQATPPGSVDWLGCGLPGAGDLKSWTNYIQRPFPPACAPGA